MLFKNWKLGFSEEDDFYLKKGKKELHMGLGSKSREEMRRGIVLGSGCLN